VCWASPQRHHIAFVLLLLLFDAGVGASFWAANRDGVPKAGIPDIILQSEDIVDQGKLKNKHKIKLIITLIIIALGIDSFT
jgi:hypothetical protein